MRRPRAHAAVSAALALLACGPGATRDLDFERMRRQRRYDPYERSGVFADGKAMQAPPAGTVPREADAGPAALVAGTEGGAPVARVPLPVTDTLLAVGRERFAIFCAACHGAAGFGGSVVAANMRDHRPPSLRTDRVRGMSAGRVFGVVSDGVGRMPSFAWALPVRERWAVVAYLAALQGAPTTDPAAFRDSLDGAALARRGR
jgi:mono/diheme cytochrome c family protein